MTDTLFDGNLTNEEWLTMPNLILNAVQLLRQAEGKTPVMCLSSGSLELCVGCSVGETFICPTCERLLPNCWRGDEPLCDVCIAQRDDFELIARGEIL
jgi:hypothetical protein